MLSWWPVPSLERGLQSIGNRGWVNVSQVGGDLVAVLWSDDGVVCPQQGCCIRLAKQVAVASSRELTDGVGFHLHSSQSRSAAGGGCRGPPLGRGRVVTACMFW